MFTHKNSAIGEQVLEAHGNAMGAYVMNENQIPTVSGFIAQLVIASHQYREVTGSNPVEVLTFSGFYT